MKPLRIFNFVILIFSSYLLANAAWRLPLDIQSGYFAELSGKEATNLPFAKSELILASLVTLLVGYLFLAFWKNPIVSIVLSFIALTVTTITLWHRYIPIPSVDPLFTARTSVMSQFVTGYTRTGESKALAAPVSSSQSVEILPSNSEVVLTGRSGEYYRAAVAGGRTAWIPVDRIIVP